MDHESCRSHGAVYELPHIYEIAFSYRDVPQECDFLLGVHAVLTGHKPGSALELACGPGLHLRELQRRGMLVGGVDASEHMIGYLRQKLSRTPIQLTVADMASFKPDRRVDLAFTLLDSLSYLTTNEQIVAHLRCVRRAVKEGGVYVVELRHPRQIFDAVSLRPARWVLERHGIRVSTIWGAQVERDPIEQTERVLVRMEIERDGSRQALESWGVQRPLLLQEFLALAGLAGCWRYERWWGSLDPGRPFEAEPDEVRIFVALRAV